MKKLSRRRFVKRGILASLSFLFLDAFWFEKYYIDWNYFTIAKDDAEPIKIVQISDLHLDGIKYFHKSIARQLNTLKPDIICITGDAVDESKNIDVLDDFLKLIDASIKKYAITGNWEYWGNVDLPQLKAMYAKHNCELLINSNRTIKIKGREVSILGVDDFVGGDADFKKTMQGLKPSQTTVVLSHCPQYRDIIEQQKGELHIDLILSGHTHGGQINILGFVPFKPQGSGSYLCGWYKGSHPKMYVSKGVGTSVLPIRFGARAEVVVIDI